MTLHEYITQVLTPAIRQQGYAIVPVQINRTEALFLMTTSLGVQPLDRHPPISQLPTPERDQ